MGKEQKNEINKNIFCCFRSNIHEHLHYFFSFLTAKCKKKHINIKIHLQMYARICSHNYFSMVACMCVFVYSLDMCINTYIHTNIFTYQVLVNHFKSFYLLRFSCCNTTAAQNVGVELFFLFAIWMFLMLL